MVCIFGFDFHNQFCFCKFADAKLSDLDTVICSKCESEIRSLYEWSLTDEEFKRDWDGDFEDFLSVEIEEELVNICKGFYSGSFVCDITGFDYNTISRKLVRLYDNFMRNDEEKHLTEISSQEKQVDQILTLT
jgi:hypothetical protein